MRESREFLVITFSETADAMAAEKLFRERAFPGRIIPIPRQLSAGCGLSWRTDTGRKEQAEMELRKAGIHWQEMEPVRLWVSGSAGK